MSTTPEVNPIIKYITADGRLTDEGLKLFVAMLNQLKDHETRIVALEP